MFIFSHFYWNPSRVMFHIPYINFPIFYYSFFFAAGFFIGYYILKSFIKRYFYNFPDLFASDIKDKKLFYLLYKKNDYINKIFLQNKITFFEKENEESIAKKINLFISKNINVKKIIKGTRNYANANSRYLIDKTFDNAIITIKSKASFISDKILFYIIVATIIGARVGEILFYQDITYYIKNPLQIFNLREGGLASHGGAFAIILAVFFLSKKFIKVGYKNLTFLKILDFISMPALLIGGFIRIGNFFNQEILGKKTNSIWGVVFGNPLDGSDIIPRHPVQIYEAIFYFLLFFIFYFLSFKPKYYLAKGRFFALFLINVFCFRFFIEFFKEKQSIYLNYENIFSMGQYLSIPFIFIGIFLLYFSYKKRGRIIQ